MVLFDNNVLCLLLHTDADVPNDPATKTPISRAADRVNYLADQLQERGVIILIPTPVLAEFLTFAAPDYLIEINQSAWFEVAPFDQRAAIEAALALRRAMAPGGPGKKLGISDTTWQKIKVDRQIVAIGKARGVTEVYTTDSDVITLARESNLKAIHVADLSLPPDEQQQMTLADLLATSPASSGSEPPVLQSPGDGLESTPEPAPGPPSVPLDGPKPQPPDSSPTVAPRPRSKK